MARLDEIGRMVRKLSDVFGTHAGILAADTPAGNRVQVICRPPGVEIFKEISMGQTPSGDRHFRIDEETGMIGSIRNANSGDFLLFP